ncbi:hypothetical protein CA3LBN_001708 [Candidozyma haemuli]|uniref:Phospholipid-transporting ATPase n=1 Tax=Candidozyma haemuli TaxID=45357 RepID=A0ABX8I4P9_9ASCO|nr:hypothetical protein CA3LBN_001708 [[Candida] haemuloni]
MSFSKSPFQDPDSEVSYTFSDSETVESTVQSPQLNVKKKPSLRFALPRNGSLRSPFADSNQESFQEPSSPMSASFDPQAPMKRLRWGTTRHATGRPKKESLGRAKTLKQVLRSKSKRSPSKATEESQSADCDLDIIDDYQDDKPPPEASPDSKDKKHETRTVFFNRSLPSSMIDTKTGKAATSYPRNKTRSAKYTPLSFAPKMLTKSFTTDYANSYFLFIIILGAFPIFGVPSPVLAAVPLIVILIITALKEMIEDSRRTAQDIEVNNQITHILTQVKEHSEYTYENPNVNDETVSLWRRFKKLNSRMLFKFIKSILRNCTKKGRAQKKREEVQPSPENNRKSFDSMVDLEPAMTRSSMVGNSNNLRSMASRKSYYGKDKTLAFARRAWKEVKVGDVIRVQNNEEVPADVLILSSSDTDNCCYVETKNLDGETNLKVKQAMKFSSQNSELKRANDFMGIDFEVESEGPHPNLYSYQGYVLHSMQGEPSKEPATVNNLMLRGCTLRNTKWAVGIVLFTGPDTKIILNTGVTPYKKSKLSRELNYYVLVNFAVLFGICFITGLFNGLYYRRDGTSRDFFEYGTIVPTPAANGAVSFFVAVILYQALVPISLYITIEIIKSLQAFFIYCDIGLYYPKLDFPCNPKSWSISDDLGQIEYVFSDKTGTLTQNLMEFRKCTIRGVSYGNAYTEALAGLRKRQGIDVEKEGRAQRELIAQEKEEMLADLRGISGNIYDDELSLVSKQFVSDLKGLSGVEQQKANAEFMLTLGLCHSVVVEEDPKNPLKKLLKAQSPDEAALVGTARALGFCFQNKNKNGYTLSIQGKEKEYQVLNTLEFNSTRKRMSAIIKMPPEDGEKESKIVLLCKGADSIIYSRLSDTKNPQEMLDKTSAHLQDYATEGLRTLCIAKRELTLEQYKEWNKRHLEASASLEGREEKMEAVADSIERELVLLGGTAIEDRLQDGVPDSISMLSEAGIKLWVLTGDKVETAINIGFSCNLLGNDMELLVLKTDLSDAEKKEHGVIPGDDNDNIMNRLVTNYLGKFDMAGSIDELEEAKKDHSTPDGRYGVVIDGDALKIALADEDIKRKFLLLCKQCKAVLCCRVSPAQKAAVVLMVKGTLEVMTLAIGDGSNDVSMIQAADVGIGIAGEEGRQAAMCSDYALGQFRFLTRLLLTHGRWAYRRMGEMIPCFFYKNINYTFALFWYSLFNDFDGSYLFDFTFLVFCNLAFTSLPVIVLAVFDQDVSPTVSMLVPQLYRVGVVQSEFSQWKVWAYMIDGLYQSVIAFFFSWLIFFNNFPTMNGLPSDHRFYVGVYVTCISCIAANTYVWLQQYRWDWVSFLCNIFGGLIIFALTGIYTSIPFSQEFYKAGAVVFGTGAFWACLFIGLVLSLLPRFCYDSIRRLYYPRDADIVRECVKRGDYSKYPRDYDPTDPNRVQVDSPKIESDSTFVEEKLDFEPQKRPSVVDLVRRSMVGKSSFYKDSTDIIETYKLENVSTAALNNIEEVASHTISRQPTNVRASLELPELTTMASLRDVASRKSGQWN